jgi:DNA polymerase-3 subunit delta'
LALFQRWGWDLLALSTVRAPTAVRYHPQQSAVLARLSAQSETAALLAWLGRLTGYRSAQDHPLNPRLVIEAALLDYIACFQRTDATGSPARAAR